MKCFIGLPAHPSVRPHLERLQKAALALDIGARPVPLDNFHLTLAFIGEISAEEAAMVAKGVDIMTDLTGKNWKIDRSGVFVRPKVCWVGGENTQELKYLAREARTILKTLNIPFDDGSFRPHITLLRHSRLDAPIVTEPFDWPILRPRLFESKLDQNGRRVYNPI